MVLVIITSHKWLASGKADKEFLEFTLYGHAVGLTGFDRVRPNDEVGLNHGDTEAQRETRTKVEDYKQGS